MVTGWPRFIFAAMLLSSLSTLPAKLQAQAGPTPNGVPAAPSSPEDEEKARGHFRLGRAHYDNGNFAQAAIEFEEAYRISQRAALLYNIYLAYRDASDTPNAAKALRSYLELVKEVENRGQLESRLAALDRSLADGTAPTPAAQQPVAAEPVAVEPAAEAEPEAAVDAAIAGEPAPEEKSNVLPIGLMAGGGAMIIGGLVFDLMSAGKTGELSDAQDKCTKLMNCNMLTMAEVKHLNDVKSSAQTLALVGDILLFGGIAVAGTGAVLFILNQSSGSESDNAPATAKASFMCLPGACSASVSGRF